MDVEKIKLIVNNMECLVRCLNEEISKPNVEVMKYEEYLSSYMSGDYDEVYTDES